jgi:serine/threonine protein kinase
MGRDSYKARWEIIDELGEGGQGKVFKVRDRTLIRPADDLYVMLRNAIRDITGGVQNVKTGREPYSHFCDAILQIVEADSDESLGALKLLHEPQDARDPERGGERIKREMEAMRNCDHPHLLRILDADPEGDWFVSEFHAGGTLRGSERFKGDLLGALKAFRPLVAGVATLHEQGLVHRDIKPENIFLAADERLVLGDFGLVFFTDAQHTRFSGTFENVGSRDWMPAWAMTLRIDEVKATFDVLALGKTLWSAVTGIPVLPLWYYDRPGSNVEELFPEDTAMKWANRLFARCIVENEADCLPSVQALLEEVDVTLQALDLKADLLSDAPVRQCRVCGLGKYALSIDRKVNKLRRFGIAPHEPQSFKVFTCDHCGHVQLFSCPNGQNPPAWDEAPTR